MKKEKEKLGIVESIFSMTKDAFGGQEYSALTGHPLFYLSFHSNHRHF
jgi:hypothetical protein